MRKKNKNRILDNYVNNDLVDKVADEVIDDMFNGHKYSPPTQYKDSIVKEKNLLIPILLDEYKKHKENHISMDGIQLGLRLNPAEEFTKNEKVMWKEFSTGLFSVMEDYFDNVESNYQISCSAAIHIMGLSIAMLRAKILENFLAEYPVTEEQVMGYHELFNIALNNAETYLEEIYDEYFHKTKE